MKLIKFLVFVLAPTFVASELDLFNMFPKGDKIWTCMSELNEECVKSLGEQPVVQLLEAKEIPLGEYVSIEKIRNYTGGEREGIEDIWDFDEIWKAGSRFAQTHALKFKFGDLEARMFKAKSKPDDVEFLVEARRRGNAKSQRIYRVIIPLVIGFKITGMIIFGIVAVKLFLLKASLVANTALLVAGGIVMKKLYDHGMGIVNSHQSYLNSHQSLPNFYSSNHDFSGFGYNGYNSNGLEGASSINSEDTVLPDMNDLGGSYSNHAIAMAALNKTLMQQQQSSFPAPKRRWTHKWANLS